MAAQASDESRYLSGVGPKRLNGSLDCPVKGTSLYKTSGMEGAGMRALCLYFVWDEGRCPQVYEGDAGGSRGTSVPCCIPEASGTHPGALGGLPRAVEVFQSLCLLCLLEVVQGKYAFINQFLLIPIFSPQGCYSPTDTFLRSVSQASSKHEEAHNML